MDRTGPDQNKTDLEALRALQADASELECIESLLNRFNVFEIIGYVNQELMHSRFLAFLLNPRQNHGLGDLFIKGVLREVLASTDETPLPAFFENLDQINLDETLVHREWQHIDILLTNEAHRLAVIIENKIWSSEHSDQLGRYHQIVKKGHLGWQVFGIYLTPFGNVPSHEAYSPLNYETVCEMLEEILEERYSDLNPDVKMAIEHYVRMVRRYIVGDEELALSCSQFYWQYQRALDLIYKHRFAQQESMRRTLRGLVEADSNLIFNSLYTKYPEEYVGFWVQDWDVKALSVADGERWTGTGRILLFPFCNYSDRIDLILQIGPGDELTRRRLLEMAHNNPSVFEDTPETLSNFVTLIFSRPILPPDFYENASDKERKQEIRRQWAEFLEQDLPRIETALKKESWIWESVEADEDHPGNPSRFVWGEGDVEINEPSEHEE